MQNIQTKDLNILNKMVKRWGTEKGILTESTPSIQFTKLQEEIKELELEVETGFYLSDTEDEIGDCLVVLTMIAELSGTDIPTCLNRALNKIMKRTGKLVGGVFVKSTN